MHSTCLTIESLNNAMAMFHSAFSFDNPVGAAVSPRIKVMLDRQVKTTEAKSMFGIAGVPLIIDPRMTSEKAEVYYDVGKWKARCKEQREWDANTYGD